MPLDLSQYRALRAAGWRAIDAHRAIRRQLPASLLDDLDTDRAVSWTVAPWTLRASMAHDPYYDATEDYGTFTDDDGPDTIPNEDTNYSNGRGYKRFRPEYSIEDRYVDARARGMSRAVAQEYAESGARSDMLRARESQYVTVTVTASRAGVELGSASLSGIDAAQDIVLPYGVASVLARGWIRETVDDLTREAMAEANATLPAVLAALAEAMPA